MKYIGLFGLNPGHIIKTKQNVWFNENPNGLSKYGGRSFKIETCLTVLEVSEPRLVHDGKERKIAVFYNDQVWYKWVSCGSFPLLFEVIL